jgi:DNA gyrase subunit A
MCVRAEPADKVFMVATDGRAWAAPVGLVPEQEAWSKMGLGRDEHVVHAGVLDGDGYLVMGTAQGKVKRTSLSVLQKELLDGVWTEVVGLAKGDRVVFAGTCGEKGEVLFFTDSRVLRTAASEISDQKTLTARGVTGVRLAKGDTLVGGAVISDPKRHEVFILSEKGYLKRLSIDQFTLQGRGGKGMQALKIAKSTGPVVAAAAGKALASSKIDVLAEDGKRQRILLKSIPRARSRQSRGKKLVTIGPVSEILLL